MHPATGSRPAVARRHQRQRDRAPLRLLGAERGQSPAPRRNRLRRLLAGAGPRSSCDRKFELPVACRPITGVVRRCKPERRLIEFQSGQFQTGVRPSDLLEAFKTEGTQFGRQALQKIRPRALEPCRQLFWRRLMGIAAGPFPLYRQYKTGEFDLELRTGEETIAIFVLRHRLRAPVCGSARYTQSPRDMSTAASDPKRVPVGCLGRRATFRLQHSIFPE